MNDRLRNQNAKIDEKMRKKIVDYSNRYGVTISEGIRQLLHIGLSTADGPRRRALKSHRNYSK